MKLSDLLFAGLRRKNHLAYESHREPIAKFSSLLIERFKLPLKAAGYRRSGQTWNKVNGQIALIVNVQQSRWNNWAYVNCGVYIGQSETFEVPKEYQCHIRFRLEAVTPAPLGDLVEGRRHDLLSASPKSPVGADADAIAEALVQFGIPFLNRFETKHKIRALIEARDQGSSDSACLFTNQLSGNIDT